MEELKFSEDLGKLPFSDIKIDDAVDFCQTHNIKITKQIITAYLQLKQAKSLNKDLFNDIISQAKTHKNSYQVLTQIKPFFDQFALTIIFKACDLPVTKNDIFGILDELGESESRVLHYDILEEVIRQLSKQ